MQTGVQRGIQAGEEDAGCGSESVSKWKKELFILNKRHQKQQQTRRIVQAEPSIWQPGVKMQKWVKETGEGDTKLTGN